MVDVDRLLMVTATFHRIFRSNESEDSRPHRIASSQATVEEMWRTNITKPPTKFVVAKYAKIMHSTFLYIYILYIYIIIYINLYISPYLIPCLKRNVNRPSSVASPWNVVAPPGLWNWCFRKLRCAKEIPYDISINWNFYICLWRFLLCFDSVIWLVVWNLNFMTCPSYWEWKIISTVTHSYSPIFFSEG